MDAVSGSVFVFLMVVCGTALCYVCYTLVMCIVRKYRVNGEPIYFKTACAVMLLLPMFILVWEPTFTGTVFTALPPYLTGLFVMRAVWRDGIKTRLKMVLLGVYMFMGLVFCWQFMN